MNRNNRNGNSVIGVIVVIAFLMLLTLGANFACGVGGWGPTQTHTLTITDKKIDISGGKDSTESHYMVYGTENGVPKAFEVDNGFLLKVWNADEVYAGINIGKTYTLTTKGKKHTNMFMQEYPYIIRSVEVTKLEQ